MRIRSIKPEFWRSPDISRLGIEDRLLFIGLWSYVDDNGVGEDRVSMISADLFADDVERDPRETFARVSRGLASLSEGGQILRYQVAGRDYLEIAQWSSHQRIDKPARSKLPRHDAEGAVFARPSRHPRDIPAITLGTDQGIKGTREQGNKGTGDQGNEASSSEIADATPRRDVEELLDLLDEEIERNGGKKPKRTKKNHDAIRLMLDRDNIPAENIAGAIRWCQADEFWRANILSASKLREKYDTLRAQAQRKKSTPKTFGQQREDNTLSLINQLREEEARGQVRGGNAAGVRQIDSGR